MSATPQRYFDAMYASDKDPWGYETRWYEQRKYDLTVAALPDRRYRRGVEPGCSIGVLTAMLAPRCEELFSTDVAGEALTVARRRLALFENVTLSEWAWGSTWPHGAVDLVVLSEVGYYLTESGLRAALADTVAHLEPGGTLLAVHWQGESDDHALHGSVVHRVIAEAGGLTSVSQYREEDFWLDVYRREL